MVNDNNIFFLGAGFSKAINSDFPLLNELSEKLLGDDLDKVPNYNFNDYIPDFCKNNIEALLTYLSSNLPWKSEKQKKADELLFICIAEKLQDYFINSLMYNSITQSFDFDNLWRYIMQEGSPIITLNYDLIPEKMLLLNTKYNERYNGYIENINNYEKFYRGKIIDAKHLVKDQFSLIDYMPEIVKLHGSANWYYSGDEKYSQIYCSDNETAIEQTMTANMKPFIVPPVLDKTRFYGNKTLEYLWNKAFNYIAKAQEIYIIGFSFPETDLSIKYLFQSALKLNTYLSQIYVINSDNTDEFKQKYISILGAEKCNFDYCGENALLNFMNKKLAPFVKEEVANANN